MQTVQQFGRVHRANQRLPPVFWLLKTSLSGEARFVAVVAKRLKSLGALCRGDSRAAMGGLGMSGVSAGFDQYDVINEQGHKAVKSLMARLSQKQNPSLKDQKQLSFITEW